jgi:hypothetical protein
VRHFSVAGETDSHDARRKRWNRWINGATMDTARLRVLRTSPEIRALLLSFLHHRELLPSNSEFINPEVAPGGLRRTIDHAQRGGRAWCAWRCGADVNALTAELDEIGCRTHGRPVLLLFLHNASGQVIGSSSWLESRPGHWSPSPDA